MKSMICGAMAIALAALSQPALAQADPSSQDDPSVTACEMSQFKGKTAVEAGFVRQAMSVAGVTVSMLYASSDGNMFEVECAFELKDGKFQLVKDAAPVTLPGLYPIDPAKTMLFADPS